MAARIAHVDMDAFYASIEIHDHPELAGKPVVVGGPSNARGVVAAASYEARRYGVHSAMPMSEAVRRCSHLVRVPARMDRYADVSKRVMSVLERFSPSLEKLSLDEAFLDLSGTDRSLGPSRPLARRIKDEVFAESGLVASVGIAPVKFVAKIASDLEKPDGLVVVEPGGVASFLAPLPLARLWGVGPRTLERLTAVGLSVVGDLATAERWFLETHFGRHGTHLQDLARGLDSRTVVPDHDAKSYSHEMTYAVDQTDARVLLGTMLDHATRVARRLRRDGVRGRVITLKLRDFTFKTITRRVTRPEPTDDAAVIHRVARSLFEESWTGRPVRLVGVGVSGIVGREGETLSLVENEAETRRQTLDAALDRLERRFGRDTVFRGGTLHADDAGDTGSSLSHEDAD